MKTQKGSIANVLRNTIGECTNNGLSATNDRFYLIGEEVRQQFETDQSRPILRLVKRHLFGADYYHCEPIEKPKGAPYMFGGNYLDVSRHDAPTKHPLPIHDRSE